MQYKKQLIRFIDDVHIRYYNIEICPTLFGEILLERVYGNIRYKHPTRIIKNYFEDMRIAQKLFNKTLNEKIKKGYVERFETWM